MGKEGLVQTASLFPGLAADEKRCTGCPENLTRFVVLPQIFFHVPKNPSAAEWKSEMIHESAGCTCIFKPGPVIVIEDMGLRGTQIRMGRRHVDQGLKPAGGGFSIGLSGNAALDVLTPHRFAHEAGVDGLMGGADEAFATGAAGLILLNPNHQKLFSISASTKEKNGGTAMAQGRAMLV